MPRKIDYPEKVTVLISHLKKIPGIGPKSAERIALWFLQKNPDLARELARGIWQAIEEVSTCAVCGFFSTENTCALCSDADRDQTRICVVEQPTDILSIERTGAYRGQYHTLGGKISPLDDVSPEDLTIASLLNRVEKTEVEEVVLAVGSDVEGEVTANYVAEALAPFSVLVTRLAQGLPAGGGLESADELTLYRALEGRKSLYTQ